jgi:hypothetical protein
MSTLAKAVHRGADGSVHYLATTAEGSLLIITDPVLGVRRLPFDGPCRLVRQGGGSAEYESISATSSISVTVNPGQEPLISELIGICTACVFPLVGQPDKGHDYGLWPYCPSSDREKDGNVVPLPPRSEPVRERVPAEPVQEPEPASSPGTSAPIGAVSASAEGAQSDAGVRWLDDTRRAPDPQYTPASEEPVTPPEIRWGWPCRRLVRHRASPDTVGCRCPEGSG